jgi:type III restriction enzyme
MYLYETIDQAKKFDKYKNLPKTISNNLNPNFELRPYQEAAFRNFVTYFETPKLKAKQHVQTLFHMATGSGKTLIMAGLIIYLYRQGYRHFLFFVNSTNIVQKTKENFLNRASSKYLFADSIIIDDESVPIKEVSNFQSVDENAINICFSTIQGLHDDMWFAKENAMTEADFIGQQTVLISDEAHHLNVLTKNGVAKSEEKNSHSWEETVKQILSTSVDNILLEFTATLDLKNPYIKKEYEQKIIFDYPLLKFRLDKYSKEIMTLRSDLNPMDRSLQAIMLSQYRLKVFQEHRLNIKPVILFKAYTIKESKDFMKEFSERIANLTGADLEQIKLTNPGNEVMNKAYYYFMDKNIDFDELASELRDDFSPAHCISANEDKETGENQIILNTLEDQANPYRAIFEVKKLDEGWDVLNLFDIVRLYETRQSSGTRISQATISEAQLIGRGARYCPFQLNDEQSKSQRKYDDDVDNEMRICETLHYHCYNERQYISDLQHALREIGLDSDPKSVLLSLKSSFKEGDLYKNGKIFINDRQETDRTRIDGIHQSVRDKTYTIRIATGESGVDAILEENTSVEYQSEIKTSTFTIKELARLNYALTYKALARQPMLKFNILKNYFPNLKSTRQFITDENYLGNVNISIKSQYGKETLTMEMLFLVLNVFMRKIAAVIDSIDITYEGTDKFLEHNICDIFKDKKVVCNTTHKGGYGYSQNDPTVNPDYRIDLTKEDWYAFSDNWGTDEEKAFVGYFMEHLSDLRKNYDMIYLIRNERQFHLYSFDGGNRFEPDFVIFLRRKNTEDGYDQLQVFIEPKGTQLLEQDKWKEDFLLQMEGKAQAVIKFASDNRYGILGFHFFNRDTRDKEFKKDFDDFLCH